MKHLWNQINLGALLGCAAFLGILQRSWESFFSVAGIAAFFASGLLAAQMVGSPRRPLHVIGAVGCVAFCAVFIGWILITAERFYLVNGSSYPTFLATDVGHVDSKQVEALRVGEQCHDQVLEIYEKTDFWILRCGYSYFDGHTFISHGAHPFADLTEGETK